MFVERDRGRCAAIGMLALLAICLGCGKSSDSSQASSGAAPSGSHLHTGNIQFVTGYEPGYRQAQESGRPMMVFFTAEWCHYCHEMAAESFTDPRVLDLAGQFTCVLVDADAENGVCEHFRVTGFPTVQFFAPNGVPLNRAVGRQSPEQVLAQMKAALQATARRVEPGKRRM